MGVNSLTYPLHYQHRTLGIDVETTLNTELIEKPVKRETHFEGIVGRSATLRRVLQMVETVATGDSTVLLLGETGTGKELIARAIHRNSPRRDRPFTKLN